jgi:hypothetical protein
MANPNDYSEQPRYGYNLTTIMRTINKLETNQRGTAEYDIGYILARVYCASIGQIYAHALDGTTLYAIGQTAPLSGIWKLGRYDCSGVHAAITFPWDGSVANCYPSEDVLVAVPGYSLDIAIVGSGESARIFAATTDGTVYEYDSECALVTSWATDLTHPLTLDSDGTYLYICGLNAGGTNIIARYTLAGSKQNEIGYFSGRCACGRYYDGEVYTSEWADEQQAVTLTGSPTGGTFTLTYDGETTGNIAYDAEASAIETALDGLSTIGAGNVAVTGDAGGPWTVRFVADLGATDLELMTGNGAGLSGDGDEDVEIADLVSGSSIRMEVYSIGGTHQRGWEVIASSYSRWQEDETFAVSNGNVLFPAWDEFYPYYKMFRGVDGALVGYGSQGFGITAEKSTKATPGWIWTVARTDSTRLHVRIGPITVQTEFYRYNESDTTSLGTPDMGVAVPALDGIDAGIVAPNHIGDMRTALEALAPYHLDGGGNPFTFATLYAAAMGNRTKYGATGGAKTTWTRTLNEMVGTPSYDIDIGEVFDIADYLDGCNVILE